LKKIAVTLGAIIYKNEIMLKNIFNKLKTSLQLYSPAWSIWGIIY